MALPLQDEMNRDDPVEHVLWALVNMGGLMGAPLGVPLEVLRVWAKHLYDCGFRHQPELQMIFYKPPADGEGLLAMGGEWIPASEPGVKPDELARDEGDAAVDAAIAEMTPAQKRALIEKLEGGAAGGGFQ